MINEARDKKAVADEEKAKKALEDDDEKVEKEEVEVERE